MLETLQAAGIDLVDNLEGRKLVVALIAQPLDEVGNGVGVGAGFDVLTMVPEGAAEGDSKYESVKRSLDEAAELRNQEKVKPLLGLTAAEEQKALFDARVVISAYCDDRDRRARGDA